MLETVYEYVEEDGAPESTQVRDVLDFIETTFNMRFENRGIPIRKGKSSKNRA